MPSEKTPYKYHGLGPSSKGSQMPEDQAERQRRVRLYAAQWAQHHRITYLPRPDEGEPGRTKAPRTHDG